MFVFLLLAIFIDRMDIEEEKNFKSFLKIYNIGLPILALTLLSRGIVEVLGLDISRAMDYFISGIACIGHILVGIGLAFFLLTLKKSSK